MKRKSNSILISLYFVLSLLICFSFTVGPIGQMRAIAEENDLPSDSVYLGGKVIGLKLPLNAVEVTGFRSIITNDGTVSPAASAGISIGDRIIKAGSKEIKNNKELFDAVDGSDGEIVLTIKRGKTEIEKTVIPAVEKISGEKVFSSKTKSTV